MWFSSGGTKSVTHTDDYENILCLLDGRKNVVLVDYYKYKDIVGSIIDVHDGSYSSMDVDSVDFTKYKGIETIEYYNVELNAGDCLYIPLKWLIFCFTFPLLNEFKFFFFLGFTKLIHMIEILLLIFGNTHFSIYTH